MAQQLKYLWQRSFLIAEPVELKFKDISIRQSLPRAWVQIVHAVNA
jgi:hypothetical protein